MKKSSFKTFSRESRIKITRKGSRFIGVGASFRQKDDLESKREKLAGEFPKATHIAYGSVIVESGRPVERYDSDGEPRGTAGKPILQVIKGEGLSNCAVFVVRYFGGRELGTGGLARAYSDAARGVIEEGNIVIEKERNRYLISFPYSFTGKIAEVIAKFDEVNVLERNYGREPELEVSVPVDTVESFFERLRSGTAGNVDIKMKAGSEEGFEREDNRV